MGPLSVNHLGQLPAVTISFNLKPGYSIGDAVSQINELARTSLPTTISTMFQGNAQAFQSSLSGLGFLVLMSILVIYLVLGILYESFVHPITILSGLPSAGFGAGAESRRALGVSVVGGLFFSQIVTLFLTPVVYIYLDNARLSVRRLLARGRFAELDVAHRARPISEN